MQLTWQTGILVALAGAAVIYAVVAWIAITFLTLRWRNCTGQFNCLPDGPPGMRPLRLLADDGAQLDACFLPATESSRPPMNIILLHGIDDSKERLLPLAGELILRGYNCLLLDLRGHGRSQPAMCTYGWFERQDVRAATDWLARFHDAPTALYGVSLGGAISLLSAADDDRICGVVAEGAYARLRQIIGDYAARCGALRFLHPPAYWIIQRIARFRFEDCDPLTAASMLAIPVLLIHGQADRHVSPDYSRQLAAAMDGNCELWLVPRAFHSRCYDLAGREYVRRLDRFFRRAAAKTAGQPNFVGLAWQSSEPARSTSA